MRGGSGLVARARLKLGLSLPPINQGSGDIPADALISRADGQPLLSRIDNQILTARAA